MKIDRNGMRPCNRCLKLRAALKNALGINPGYVDMEVRCDSPGINSTALVRMRADTGAIVSFEPDKEEDKTLWRKMLADKHVIFERSPVQLSGKLMDRVTRRYFPVTVMASKITDTETGETLSNTD